MKNYSIFTLALSLLFSCSDKNEKINYDTKVDTMAVINNTFEDSTKILVSELPVKFDSIDLLIYPVGLVDLHPRGSYSKIGSGSYSGSSSSSSYFNDDKITGSYINLIFENPDGTRKSLSNMKMTIISTSFLRDIYKRTKKGYLLYTIYDRDTNRDGAINRDDLEALYISQVDGTGLTKISKELHEFYDYRILKGSNSLYFRTLEDINKDGKLNNEDQFHYYKIDLGGNDFIVEEYNPLDVFEK